jgi:cobaltochelatase CobT
MGKNNKRKREPTPPSEDFGDSEYSEEEFSSESEGSPALIPLRESSDDSDDSQGLTAEVWTYIRAVERSGLEGSDESEYSSDEEDSDGGGEDEDGDDDDDEDEGGGDVDGDGSGKGGGGDSRGSNRGSSNRGSNQGGSGGRSNRASG